MRDWQRTINNDKEFEKTWEQLVRLKDKATLDKNRLEFLRGTYKAMEDKL